MVIRLGLGGYLIYNETFGAADKQKTVALHFQTTIGF